MRITLIRPRPEKESIGLMHLMICEPLELEYLSAHLKECGHEVCVLDMILERKNIVEIVKSTNPGLIGITSYITHVGVVKNYAKRIKKYLPNVPIIVGGVHAEVCPEDFESECIDYIAYVNGMITIGELAKKIEIQNDREKNIETIEGLWAGRCAKEYLISKNAHLPRPDRSCTARYRRWYSYLFHVPCALLKTSYGCPYKCKFCFCRQITRGEYFERPIRDVVDEMLEIEEPNIFIVDDNFLLKEKRVLSFCSLLEKRRIHKKFILFGRADFIARNPSIINKLSRVGLEAVFVGIESFKDEELRDYGKRCTVKTNEAAARILWDCGVDAYTGVVIRRDWTARDFSSLTAWLTEHHLDLTNIQPLTPLPGTPYYDKYKDSLVIDRSEYGKWDLTHLAINPTNLNPRQFYAQIILAYFRTTATTKIGKYIIRRYGIKVALRIFFGSLKIAIQYIKLWARCESV